MLLKYQDRVNFFAFYSYFSPYNRTGMSRLGY